MLTLTSMVLTGAAAAPATAQDKPPVAWRTLDWSRPARGTILKNPERPASPRPYLRQFGPADEVVASAIDRDGTNAPREARTEAPDRAAPAPRGIAQVQPPASTAPAQAPPPPGGAPQADAKTAAPSAPVAEAPPAAVRAVQSQSEAAAAKSSAAKAAPEAAQTAAAKQTAAVSAAIPTQDDAKQEARTRNPPPPEEDVGPWEARPGKLILINAATRLNGHRPEGRDP